MASTRGQAIETHYGGCRFRSRTEARWAVFFDHVKIRWDYEKEGFQFPDGSRYLPDFWLPDFKVWWEVKSDGPSKESDAQLAEQLFATTNAPVVMSFGMPGAYAQKLYCNEACDTGSGASWRVCEISDPDGLGIAVHSLPESRTFYDGNWVLMDRIKQARVCYSKQLDGAIAAARSARFEHGEVG